jgi:quercetin dioxygenase-like cupin family protein
MAQEELNPTASRQVIHSARMTVARLSLKKGAVVPLHHHDNEQLTMLESGRLLFHLGGEEITVEAGDVLEIPPNVPHDVVALEDSVAVDVFAPGREDWKRGDDAYLRQR